LSRATPWLVGAFYGTAMLDLVTTTGAAAASLALTVALGVALIWRHERPELVTGAVLAVSLGAHLLVPEVVVPVGGMVAVWALARARPPRVSLLGLAGLVALSAINLVTTTLDDTLFTIGVSVAVWALAEAARNRATAISEATRRAVSEEQARIARELHDVVAHSVTVIVVQAGAANDVFDSHPEQARTALRSIEGAGREALRELRRLLTDVRTEGGRTGDGTGDGAPGAADVPAPPQPGLDRVDELADPLRAAGLQVVVTRDGPPVALPPGVDISAYRIVQEALTNILRHARASVAEVTFRYEPDAVEIEVVDDGRPAAGRSGDGPGLGLVGMNERASTLGGTFEAGPTAHGGFRVHARLPLDAAR
jgi:signal transduction histidine kinase